jgi:hypothetical protein
MSKTNGKVVTKNAIVKTLDKLWDDYNRWKEIGIIKEGERRVRHSSLIGVANAFGVLKEFVKS